MIYRVENNLTEIRGRSWAKGTFQKGKGEVRIPMALKAHHRGSKTSSH